MSYMEPYYIYTPTRTADASGGGFTETLKNARQVWGVIAVHQGEIGVSVDRREETRAGDIIIVEEDDREEQYRIIGAIGVPGTQYKRITIEKVDKPIPVSEDD